MTEHLHLPRGFRYAGVACGIKPGDALDLALIFTDAPAVTAAVFTQNRYAAAPVQYDRILLETNPQGVHAVLVNSGNANAVTGPQGMANARRMAEAVEHTFGLDPWSAMVMSTGVIGVQLPIERIEGAMPELFQALRGDTPGFMAAARAIMTTDTHPKVASTRLEIEGREVVIAGMSKGAGMIHPNMATMLAFITTDAPLSLAAAREAIRRAADASFNRISVDSDTSTNDTAALLANGMAGGPVIEPDTPAFDAFLDALTGVSIRLAQAIVRDGEGATKFVTIRVEGLASDRDAHRVAETIATSPLVKTAIYGGDANWGRILAAAGRSGVPFDPEAAELWITGGPERDAYLPRLHIVSQGMPLPYEEADAAARFAQPELLIELSLGDGPGKAVMWTCDLSHEYVTINGEYRT
jgi:glutamate N-acetyltransferase/amino-acid N-acetyltransferase